MVTLRPGQRSLNIPAIGVSTSRRAVSAGGAGVDWSQWLDHAWIAKGAASLAVSYADLVGSTTLTEGIAPGLGADGWICAASAYLRTGIVHAQNWTLAIRLSNANAAVGIAAGASSSATTTLGASPNLLGGATNAYFWHGSGTLRNSLSGDHVLIVAGNQAYIDGVPDVTISGWSGTNTQDVWIGTLNNVGVSAFPFTGTIAAVGLKSTALNSTAAAELSAAMAAL